jgi:hypothetical protein
MDSAPGRAETSKISAVRGTQRARSRRTLGVGPPLGASLGYAFLPRPRAAQFRSEASPEPGVAHGPAPTELLGGSDGL